jgi:hypothetical protein
MSLLAYSTLRCVEALLLYIYIYLRVSRQTTRLTLRKLSLFLFFFEERE